MAQLNHGSLFSGIGGIDLGFENAGINTLWQVEIDPFANAVLGKHWSEIQRFKDVKNVGKHNLLPVNVISGGFPCQDVSHSGVRKGLSASRTGLFFEATRIIGELQPEWIILENVPGLLSSNKGQDFAIVIKTLTELRYGVAWRVLDSQFFGVPQKRRRIFIVGRLGRPCPPEVLFECETSVENSYQSEKGNTSGIEARPVNGGGLGSDKYPDDKYSNAPVEPPEPRRLGNSVCDHLAGEGGHAGTGSGDSARIVCETAIAGGIRGVAGVPERLDGCSNSDESAPKNEKRRYKAAGNAACVNVCSWIAQRIVDAGLR